MWFPTSLFHMYTRATSLKKKNTEDDIVKRPISDETEGIVWWSTLHQDGGGTEWNCQQHIICKPNALNNTQMKVCKTTLHKCCLISSYHSTVIAFKQEHILLCYQKSSESGETETVSHKYYKLAMQCATEIAMFCFHTVLF